jgi:hypothetical protein
MLKHTRNAETWTHSLPREVLAHIFYIVQCSPAAPYSHTFAFRGYDFRWSRICVSAIIPER